MTQTLPPPYYWLWHLAALKVIDADFGPAPEPVPPVAQSALRTQPAPQVTGTQWDRIAALGSGQATVALIDTGVGRTHPNLASRIDTLRSIDLTSHRYGAQHPGPQPETTPMTREGRRAFFDGLTADGLRLTDLAPDEADFFEAMVKEYRTSQGVLRHIAEPEDSFAGHGTACAGLMVGEPALVADGGSEPLAPETVLTGGAMNPNPNLLPYFGVDPFSRLLSIRTSFEDDPYQFIAAFLYAWHCRVDAIVVPRGLPDPVRSRLAPKDTLKANLETWASRKAADQFHRLSVSEAETDTTAPQAGFRPDRPWKILRQLILAVSQHIPVFCAAGNDGESQLIYPASLADPGNGVFAVGAVTAEGFRAGYSNYGDGLTLVVPSDDSGVLNRHQARVDKTDPLLAMHDVSVGSVAEIAFCPLDLVTTDLPGVFGYDAGTAPWSSLPPRFARGGGYYTAFGGTSGAACLAGGLAVLAQRARRAAGKEPLGGMVMKLAMTGACARDAVVAPGYRPLTPDPMNADDEVHLEPEYFFGAGLPDAAALITAVLDED